MVVTHYSDVIMNAMVHQTTGVSIVYSTACKSKKTSKLRVTGLCERNSPVTGEFHTQRARNAENVSIWGRHHGMYCNVGHNKCWHPPITTEPNLYMRYHLQQSHSQTPSLLSIWILNRCKLLLYQAMYSPHIQKLKRIRTRLYVYLFVINGKRLPNLYRHLYKFWYRWHIYF